jgi:hypothetical protein
MLITYYVLCGAQARHAVFAARREQELATEEAARLKAAQFKVNWPLHLASHIVKSLTANSMTGFIQAKPLPDLDAVYQPHPSNKPLTVPESPPLVTIVRAKDRVEFDARMQQKELAQEVSWESQMTTCVQVAGPDFNRMYGVQEAKKRAEQERQDKENIEAEELRKVTVFEVIILVAT